VLGRPRHHQVDERGAIGARTPEETLAVAPMSGENPASVQTLITLPDTGGEYLRSFRTKRSPASFLDILERRLNAGVLLVKALGGGWDTGTNPADVTP
jgi:hypothetical protein